MGLHQQQLCCHVLALLLCLPDFLTVRICDSNREWCGYATLHAVFWLSFGHADSCKQGGSGAACMGTAR